MKKKYIINKGYKVRYNLKTLLLCYDYFNHGLPLPQLIDYIFVRKFIHIFLRYLIIVAYILRIYHLRYKVVKLRENADIIFRGKGEWANTVKLVEKNGELKIIKKTFDKKTYLREKKYYKSYINNSSKLLLPKMIFHKNNTIEIDFLKMKSFQRLINEGSLDMKQSLSHVRIINKELKVFYRKRSTLIHSDLSPENIFIKGNEYYLIDFADSRKAEMQYDKYMLLRSVIFSFNHNKVNKKTNIYSLRREHLSKLLKVNTSKIIKFEEQFKELDIKKHPKHATETFQKKNQHLYTINKPIYSI